MARFRRLLGGLSALVLLLTITSPSVALAHERRPVAGKYQLVVGFLNEPAVTGQMNGIDLRVTSIADGKPVEGLEKTLRAEVVVGGGAHSMPVELEARYGQPGAYVGYFIPTRDGAYTFHFSGTIASTPVDERFESGPSTFEDVQSAQALQFPDKLPEARVAASELDSARGDASVARALALGGLVVGAAGLAVGALALTALRRSRQAHLPRPVASRESA